MILKEWSEAQDVYKATTARWRRSVKAILALHKVKSYWYVWAAHLFLIPSIASMVLSNGPFKAYDPKWWIGLSVWLTAPLALLCIYGAIDKALAKEFAAAYEDHGILHYPFWSRRTYFNYVLFLEELKDRKYSHEQLAKLSGFAEIAKPPEEPPIRPFQNPIVIPLMGVLTALCIEVVKQSVSNNSKAILFLILGLHYRTDF